MASHTFWLKEGFDSPVAISISIAPHLQLGSVGHPPLAFKSIVEPDYHQHVIVRTSDARWRELYDDGACSVNTPLAWSPSGDCVYHAHRGLRAIDVNSGESRVIWKGIPAASLLWNLQCCPGTGKLYVRMSSAAEHLLELDPAEHFQHRLIYSGDFFGACIRPEANRAVVWQHGFLRLIELDSGEVTTQMASPESMAFDLAPNGVFLAVGGDALRIVDLSSLSSSTVVVPGLGPGDYSPSWSPCGNRLAFLGQDFELWCCAAEDLAPQRLVGLKGPIPSTRERGGSFASPPIWSPDGRFLMAQLTWSEQNPDGGSDPHLDDRFLAGHVVSIVDFETNKVALLEGYWHPAAFQSRPHPVVIPDDVNLETVTRPRRTPQIELRFGLN